MNVYSSIAGDITAWQTIGVAVDETVASARECRNRYESPKTVIPFSVDKLLTTAQKVRR